MSHVSPLGYKLVGFSHGTMPVRDGVQAQAFFKEFLGLHSVIRATRNQYMWLGGEWVIVGLEAPRQTPPIQNVLNRFALSVATPAEVDEARRAALDQQAKWAIREITQIETDEFGSRSFSLQDSEGNWWEIQYAPASYYDELFKRGDHASAA